MWARLRDRAPTIAAFFDRQPDVLDHAVFVGLLATAAAVVLVFDRIGPLGRTLAWTLFALTVAQIGVFVATVAAVVHLATLGRVGWAASQSVGATVTLGILAIERTHRAFFGRFLDRSGVLAAWDAIRTGALPVDVRSVVAWVFAGAFVCLSLSAVLHALAHVPRSERATAFASTAAPYTLLAVATLGALRDVVFDDSAETLSSLRKAIPWDGPNGRRVNDERSHSPEDVLWASASEEHLFHLLQSRRSQLRDAPLVAKVTPDILVVHVEGLRADMLRDDVAPNLLALARDSLAPERHYSTGNNTGSGMFGLLNGLSAYYYALAKRGRAQPIPLEILRRLGYFESAYFVSNLEYEEIYDLNFKGIVDYTYRDGVGAVDEAEARMVDAYLALRVARTPDRPYFDYLVFDSTHYGYHYPPTFERFKPVDTLGLGASNALIVRPGINDELRPRGPAVRNRYKNSILYIDSLLRRIFDAMRHSGALDRTAVVVTGDHGEEFWEHGSFGHGSAFHEEQMRVAFLMRLPGGSTTRYVYGSHADVMPTLFDHMGLETSHIAFMTGKSLLRYDSSLDVAVTGEGLTGDEVGFWFAVMTEGRKFVFRNKEPFPIREARSEVDDEVIATYNHDVAAEAVFRALATKQLR